MSNQRVVVIAAHPDDEVLGCGGTLALHTAAGDEVTVVIACEGESLRYGPEGVGQREHSQNAARELGVTDVRWLGFPDQRLDALSLVELITPLERIIAERRPTTIYCQYGGDVNRDHELLFKAVLVATRPTEEFIQTVLAFDTASSTEWAFPRSFVPDTWVDIRETLEQKLAAMDCYRSELRDYPHPRSLEALAHKAKAFGNQVCLESAEVFQTIRRVLRHGKTPV
jgi:LmbE family N-acetylglucosaminyl deacetylase